MIRRQTTQALPLLASLSHTLHLDHPTPTISSGTSLLFSLAFTSISCKMANFQFEAAGRIVQSAVRMIRRQTTQALPLLASLSHTLHLDHPTPTISSGTSLLFSLAFTSISCKMADSSPLPYYFRDLQSQKMPEIVAAFIQANPGHPVIKAISEALADLIHTTDQCSTLTTQLLGTLDDVKFKNQFHRAIKLHMENHPLETTSVVVVIVMLCNPLAMPNLKPPNLTASLIAAAWLRNTKGCEAADRALHILRSMGMVVNRTAVVRNLTHEERQAMLSAIQGQNSILSIRKLFDKLIATATDPEFYRALFHVVINHVKEHPWQAGIITVGLVLILNPIGLAGFGALGPVAGSLAAAWQATYGGYVVAGSLFSVLQMLGMVGAVAIPMSGLGLVSAALIFPKLKGWIESTVIPALMMQWEGLTSKVKGWWERFFGGGGHDHED
ncbi:hypothetical protein K440DRAFT_664674 [Wilcoxina mikolae CBS 423.85]|nr:hypothetical protein K440DRAFT_664674 [Wilcoxina mikolae CBS 423.85]